MSQAVFLPNPLDVGTAIYLEHLGFKALATTSAGFAFSRGKPDGWVSLEEMLGHIGEIAAATTLPVNANFLNGFADEPEAVATNTNLCITQGVAGLSIEDNTGNSTAPLYEKKLAVECIRAARNAVDIARLSITWNLKNALVLTNATLNLWFARAAALA